MKVSATREHLLEALQSVIGVVERRQTMPILSNVLLGAREHRLRITGTDLEVELAAAAEVSVQQPGEITVPGRKLLDSLDVPEPWRGHVDASLLLIDQLERQIVEIERELKRSGADHRYVPLLLTAPGIGWVLAFTIASEIGDIGRFSSPVKLTGYTGLCPRVIQSGEMDRRGPLSKHGPRYLRWGLMEAAIAASSHPLYRERYQRTKRRLGKQRGPRVAQIELARTLADAIWYMLTRNQPFAPAGAINRLAA